jgi:peptidyl-tRNA hydrolase, PTH2 family
MKQAILIRTDLKMGKGKICSQACHASIGSFLKTDGKIRERWLNEGMKKVILKVSSEKELKEFYREAKKEKLVCELITDAGLTQVEEGTVTTLGIGPDAESKINKITGKLKLL